MLSPIVETNERNAAFRSNSASTILPDAGGASGELTLAGWTALVMLEGTLAAAECLKIETARRGRDAALLGASELVRAARDEARDLLVCLDGDRADFAFDFAQRCASRFLDQLWGAPAPRAGAGPATI